MQKEKVFFYHCNVFEYNHDLSNSSKNIVYDPLEYDVLDNSV